MKKNWFLLRIEGRKAFLLPEGFLPLFVTFVTSVYGNLEIVSILKFRVSSETCLFYVNPTQLN